ncbi:hypothetical protein LPJ64_005783, partial [Coemansia asiatica]
FLYSLQCLFQERISSDLRKVTCMFQCNVNGFRAKHRLRPGLLLWIGRHVNICSHPYIPATTNCSAPDI